MASMRGSFHRRGLMMLMFLRNRRRGQHGGSKYNPDTHTHSPSLLYNAASASIHTAIPTIIRFSVRETKPSGTLELPPTQAHLSSRLSR